jgi:hypothetical protein
VVEFDMSDADIYSFRFVPRASTAAPQEPYPGESEKATPGEKTVGGNV